MSETHVLSDLEKLTAVVYGDTFALYDRPSFDEFLEPLKTRLEKNGIHPDAFKGKRCLDAGCGGRGSILMAQWGAKEVIGVDLSAKNVESSRSRAQQYGFSQLSFQQHSLSKLPLENESFDVVWCNGVLHHTTEPDQGLKEITRVLKKGGSFWLYLYGSGGIYWYVMDALRDLLRGIDVPSCISQLRLMGASVRRIAEWIDDWFVPHLRRYTRQDVMNRLKELGYEDIPLLDRGVEYDTSERRTGASDRERTLMGDGDVRYYGRKLSDPRGDRYALPEAPDGKGSVYQDAAVVMQFASALQGIAQSLRRLGTGRYADTYKVIVAASVHSKVRALLETSTAFDEKALSEHLALVQSLVNQLPV